MENTITLSNEEFAALLEAQTKMDILASAVKIYKYDSDIVLAVKLLLGIKEEDNA